MKKLNLLLLSLFATIGMQAQTKKLIVGTYTNKGTSEGIYSYDFNVATGDAQLKSIAKDVENPSYLTLSPDRKFAYSVNEAGDKSSLSAFTYDNGVLKFINKKGSHGNDPCYIIADDKNVIIANYSGGTISVYGRNADGSLTDVKQIIQHTGKSTDPKGRQKSAHVHQVVFSPDKKFVLSNDLGEDQIYIYQYHPASANKVLSIKTVYKTQAASGPRHLTFTPNGKFVYLAHEFTGDIVGYVYRNGSLTKFQDVASTPKGFTGKIDAADIHVSADGKFLYETNRGDANTISVFAILSTGILRPVETISTLGKGPRNFTISPDGKFVLVAHQYTEDIVIFSRNSITGKLEDSNKRIKVGVPVCLVFDK